MKRFFLLLFLLVLAGAGCSLFEQKPEETLTERVTREQREKLENRDTVALVKQLFGERYEIENTDPFQITIEDETLNHIRGRVLLDTGAQSVPGLFYASNVIGDWVLVYDGDAPVSCLLLETFQFPERMRTDCVQVPIPEDAMKRFPLFLTPDMNKQVCMDRCGDTVCDAFVCQGTDCPCAEDYYRCPADCPAP